MNNLKEIIPLVLLAGSYVLFSHMKGFEGEIQKLLKVKGMQNVIVQSILFVVVVISAQYVYSHIIGNNLYEGLDDDESVDDIPNDLLREMEKEEEENEEMDMSE